MAEDQEQDGPSLEPPTLFRRRKKAPEPPAAPAAPVAPTTAPATAADPVDESPTTILDDVGPVAQAPGPRPTAPPPVSYTHLTLPTIYSV